MLGKEISVINDNNPPSNNGRRPGDAVSNTKKVGVPSEQILAEALDAFARLYSDGSDMSKSASKSNQSLTFAHTPVSSRERSRNSCRASSPYSCLKPRGYR